MIRTYFIFLLVAGMFGAMLSNCGGTRGARSASEPNAFDREKAYQADVLANGYKEKDNSYAGQDVVELRREPDGHFYADVEINNMPVHILVDTGASGIALSREDARRAGLADVDRNVRGRRRRRGRRRSRGICHARLGPARQGQPRSKTPAVILDGGEKSLLGQSFLRQFASVEIKGDTMVLR